MMTMMMIMNSKFQELLYIYIYVYCQAPMLTNYRRILFCDSLMNSSMYISNPLGVNTSSNLVIAWLYIYTYIKNRTEGIISL